MVLDEYCKLVNSIVLYDNKKKSIQKLHHPRMHDTLLRDETVHITPVQLYSKTVNQISDSPFIYLKM